MCMLFSFFFELTTNEIYSPHNIDTARLLENVNRRVVMDDNIVICFHSSSLSCFVEYRKDIPFLIVRSSGQQKIHEPVYKGIQHTHITC